MFKNGLNWRLLALLLLIYAIVQVYYYVKPEEKNCSILYREANTYLEDDKAYKAKEAFREACEKCPEVPIYCQAWEKMNALP